MSEYYSKPNVALFFGHLVHPLPKRDKTVSAVAVNTYIVCWWLIKLYPHAYDALMYVWYILDPSSMKRNRLFIDLSRPYHHSVFLSSALLYFILFTWRRHFNNIMLCVVLFRPVSPLYKHFCIGRQSSLKTIIVPATGAVMMMKWNVSIVISSILLSCHDHGRIPGNFFERTNCCANKTLGF